MAEKVERKLATILSTDVVGYDRLIAADEAGSLRWSLRFHLPQLALLRSV